ncbi:hypothetical protein HRE53_24250 [Acaryochloris sp. 'Moss Beach']|uniref:hypothetical protein n=1 Tax=Acaryochloris sp. 'Moss Beach' TaxID=2740837 RepID=UPI001F2D00F1|nr:hypothetical protein [Acaryochloris sp. 'Moss Beach']UJB69422.1 hypothetical protein HRE53_24250 [Acaryochloris sp. 'Moss Beach']
MSQGDQSLGENQRIHSASAGYSPGLSYLSDRDRVCRLAAQILQDPLAQSRLCDRIYELMQNDLQNQRERNYGGGTSG